MKRAGWVAAILGVLAALVVGANLLYAGGPVREALKSDSRNEGIEIRGHLGYWILPRTLVLDARHVDGDKAVADVMRALFQTAEAFYNADREFETVVLAQGTNAVYWIDGEDFYDLGSDFARDENPLYLMRTLPQMLRDEDGDRLSYASGGGLFGAVRQMEDASDAVVRWFMP